jgi:uncharacterized membrane-anchored protein
MEEVLLQTRPVDPRDIFRGDYVTLSYDISDFNRISNDLRASNHKAVIKALVIDGKEVKF